MTAKCKCGRELDPMIDTYVPSLCKLCEHLLIRPVPFHSFKDMIFAATSGEPAGVALVKHISVDQNELLATINGEINDKWLSELESIAKRLGGGDENV